MNIKSLIHPTSGIEINCFYSIENYHIMNFIVN